MTTVDKVFVILPWPTTLISSSPHSVPNSCPPGSFFLLPGFAELMPTFKLWVSCFCELKRPVADSCSSF